MIVAMRFLCIFLHYVLDLYMKILYLPQVFVNMLVKLQKKFPLSKTYDLNKVELNQLKSKFKFTNFFANF